VAIRTTNCVKSSEAALIVGSIGAASSSFVTLREIAVAAVYDRRRW